MSGIPRDFSLVNLLLVSPLWVCIFGYPWLPLPGLWADVGSGFRLVVALFVGFGVGLLSSARCVGFVCLVGLPVGICWFLYRADAPFPMFIGEVLFDFRCL